LQRKQIKLRYEFLCFYFFILYIFSFINGLFSLLMWNCRYKQTFKGTADMSSLVRTGKKGWQWQHTKVLNMIQLVWTKRSVSSYLCNTSVPCMRAKGIKISNWYSLCFVTCIRISNWCSLCFWHRVCSIFQALVLPTTPAM